MKRLTIFCLCIFILWAFVASCTVQTTHISSPIQTSGAFDISNTPTPLGTPNPKYKVVLPLEAGGPVPDIEFDLSDTKFDLPVNLKIYRNVKPDITAEYMQSLCAKFGINKDIGPGGEGGFSIRDESSGANLWVYSATGTFRYFNMSKLYPKEKPLLPSDEEAKKIAMNFLTERGLLPEGDVASGIQVGGTSSYGPAHLLVSFSHAVEIQGPGAKHGVRIGNNGEVIDVFINPTNPLVLPVEELAPAKSLKEACDELFASKTYVAPENSRSAKITGVKVVYWLESIDTFQEYIVPIYRLDGECFDKSGNSAGGFAGRVPALK